MIFINFQRQVKPGLTPGFVHIHGWKVNYNSVFDSVTLFVEVLLFGYE